MKYIRTKRFHKSYKNLPFHIQEKAKKAFSLFKDNPYHPSLFIKKMKGKENVWEGRVDDFYRFIFHHSTDPDTGEKVCVFTDIGTHDPVERDALLTLHGKGYEVDARQADRHLDEAERQALVLTLHAGAQGEWDWDKLIAFDAELLRDTFDAELLKTLNNDALNIKELLNAEKAEHSETTKAKCICANCGCECVA
jgi:mRNA-degrading endonuclease RelE of RelBE toxin-antitoxin system